MSASFPPIRELRRRLQAGKIRPTELIDQLEAAIVERDGALGAYLGRDLETARREAEAADLDRPLGGIPIGIKDNLNVLGQPCTCGSRYLEHGYLAPYDATVVERLRAAGAIPFGRLNMDEFAMGSSTENSALGRTVNPHDPERVPGGSSGGSAAAVGAGLAIATLGSETGGSVRQPASHCGVVGLKPSYGRVSRYGLVAFASSLDQVGPVGRHVEDVALLLQAIAGHDPRDSTSLDVPVPDYLPELEHGVEGLRLGLPAEYFDERIDPAVRELVTAAARRLEDAGAELVELSLPHTGHAIATYYIIAPAEASSNLARFDGIRYGHRSADADDLLELYRDSREEGFGPEVKRRILLGTYVLSSGYYDAYYGRAQKVRGLIRRDFDQAFETVDAILAPTVPAPPRKLGENADDPLKEYLSDLCTVASNLAGNCAISVPCGTVESDSGTQLPVGLQVIAPHLAEPLLLRVARAAEATLGPDSARAGAT